MYIQKTRIEQQQQQQQEQEQEQEQEDRVHSCLASVRIFAISSVDDVLSKPSEHLVFVAT